MSISPADDNKVLIRRLVEQVYNKGNMAILDEILGADVAHRDPFPTKASGRDAIKQGIARLRRVFSDLRITVDAIVAEGDTVAYRTSYHGTHSRPFLSRPPTRRPVTFTALNMARIYEGRIVEHWTMIDRRELVEQLGAPSVDRQAGR